ncbi:hypothetical protein ACKKBG_A28520 [Auxenochlorella protothecoides x Auxenochlorella symbiontica]|uniref:Mitochondrial import inner membrane translocase subunit Tim22 n=1 Tax=Auxenochlorella protothecoides TaxID=3075 RepID=A0A087SG65_AUXPR|nr:Mitochondrial import inner membrane translocase subunit Tim22 [Auxenochlorella protothecoides]KFM24719.1 Mitochondrial import inner membrane translocase subunit Tim22 [Auxenochlorella protothecoides]RMZ52966.1 hypothetical protein APUTEX25_001085 [Auxenochlorella protothecoides]|eukprot:RMZ52966.1 hypothetical protein APUTEX25_001085 [Auxenochlorella protothecoides]
MSFPSDRPEDCATRIGMGVASGAVTGAFLGAVASNWGDIPLVLRNKPLPALLRTGNVMVNYGATLAVVGLTYSAVDCVAESLRGKQDWVNGSLAGLATGGVLGIRMGRIPVGIAAGAVLAFTSAMVDVSGQKLRSDGYVDDGATTGRTVYPYDA